MYHSVFLRVTVVGYNFHINKVVNFNFLPQLVRTNPFLFSPTLELVVIQQVEQRGKKVEHQLR